MIGVFLVPHLITNQYAVLCPSFHFSQKFEQISQSFVLKTSKRVSVLLLLCHSDEMVCELIQGLCMGKYKQKEHQKMEQILQNFCIKRGWLLS